MESKEKCFWSLKGFCFSKKGMSISIIFLVVLTLVLVSLTLYSFIVNENEKEISVSSFEEINRVYEDGEYFGVYFESFFEKSVKGFDIRDRGSVLLNRLKSELDKNPFYSKYGNNISYSFEEKDLEITEDKVVLNVRIEVSRDSEKIKIKHRYEKSFEVFINKNGDS